MHTMNQQPLPIAVIGAGPVGLAAAAARLLAATGWQSPDPETYPTGRTLVEEYLTPLASLPNIAPYVRVNSQVIAVARAGFDKMKTDGRAQAPFQLQIVHSDGSEELLTARAVIDASGTSTTPSPLGASGLP